MKSFMNITLFLSLSHATYGLADSSCLSKAADALNTSLNTAKRELHRATESCLKFPQIDAKQDCVNAAFAVYEKQSDEAQARYKISVENCGI